MLPNDGMPIETIKAQIAYYDEAIELNRNAQANAARNSLTPEDMTWLQRYYTVLRNDRAEKMRELCRRLSGPELEAMEAVRRERFERLSLSTDVPESRRKYVDDELEILRDDLDIIRR